MIAHFSFYVAAVLTAAAIFYVAFIRRDQFDDYRDKVHTPPSCFRGFGIVPPSAQEQAENDCGSCPWSRICIDRDPPVKTLP